MDESTNSRHTAPGGPDRSGYNPRPHVGDFVGPPREHYFTGHSWIDAITNFSNSVVGKVTKLAIRLIKHTSPQLLTLRLESPYLLQPYYVNNDKFAWIEGLLSHVSNMRDHLYSKYHRTSLSGPLLSYLNWFNPLRRRYRNWVGVGERKSAVTPLAVDQPELMFYLHRNSDLSFDDLPIDVDPLEEASLHGDASRLLKGQAAIPHAMALTKYHTSPQHTEYSTSHLHVAFRPTIFKPIPRQEDSSNRSPLTRAMLRTNADKLRSAVPFRGTLNRTGMPPSQLYSKTRASLLSMHQHELDILPSPFLFSSRDSFTLPITSLTQRFEKGSVAFSLGRKKYPPEIYPSLSNVELLDNMPRTHIKDSPLVSIRDEKADRKDTHTVSSEPDFVLASVAWMTEKQPFNVNKISNEPPLAAFGSPGRGSVTQPHIALAPLDRGDYNGKLGHSVAKEPSIGTSSENQNVVPTIDADSLANDVYRILKLRLAVEKERSFFGGC